MDMQKIREAAQDRIDGLLVARMIQEFAREFREVYPSGVHLGFTAVGPMQSFIGLAIKNGHLSLCDAAEAQPVAPEGWKLVPVEPTEGLYDANGAPTSFAYFVRYSDFVNCYRAMLAAAPASPPVQQEGVTDEAAKILAEWLGYSWDGLGEGRITDRGFPVFVHHPQTGWCFQGRKQDLRDLTDRIARALAPADMRAVEATHRHKKRGTEYVLIGYGRMQAEDWVEAVAVTRAILEGERLTSVDMHEVAIYRSVDDGSLWVRPREEFEDGRFAALRTVGDTESGERK